MDRLRAHQRRRLISYSAIPAATPAFSDSTPPLIGMAATVSQASRTSRDRPVSSLPTTSTSGPAVCVDLVDGDVGLPVQADQGEPGVGVRAQRAVEVGGPGDR